MREVKAVTITKEEFAPYGTFYDMTHPDDIHFRARSTNSIRTAFPEQPWAAWHFHPSK